MMLGNIPREVWDNIFAFRQPIPSLASSEHSKHRRLWNSIFKSDVWIQEITRLQGNLLLFGPMLDQVREKRIYMTIHCADRIADPNYRWELFLECLHRPYKYNPRVGEIKFPWGITLNVSEIESPKDPFLQIFTLQPYHIIGIGEPPYYSKALKYGYAVNFQDGNNTTQVLFSPQI